jgi:hypothetical protein
LQPFGGVLRGRKLGKQNEGLENFGTQIMRAFFVVFGIKNDCFLKFEKAITG